MAIPKPWCTKHPSACVEAVGVISILFSVIGGVLLVTLPVAMLDLNYEVKFIQDYYLRGGGFDASAANPENLFTLNVTGVFKYDCNQLTQSIDAFLRMYLKGKTYYTLNISRSTVIKELDETTNATVSTRILCEIHVQTRKSPRNKVVEVKGIKYSFLNIVADAISQLTEETTSQVEKKMRVHSPTTDQIAQGKVYPTAVGNDPERLSCISEKMRHVDKQDVLDMESLVYTMLGTSCTLNLVAGCLLLTSAFVVSRLLLLLTFLVESLSLGLLAVAIFAVNDSLMCLFQYGGISNHASGTPDSMQTIITYSSSIYAASFKLYCLWLTAAYFEMAPSLKKINDSPDYSKEIAEAAAEVKQRNLELAQQNQNNDSTGDKKVSPDDKKNPSDNVKKAELPSSSAGPGTKPPSEEKKFTAADKKPRASTFSRSPKNGTKQTGRATGK